MATKIMDSIMCMLSSIIVVVTIYKLLIPRKASKYFAGFVPLFIGFTYYFVTYSSWAATAFPNVFLRQKLVPLSMGIAYFIFVTLGFSDRFKEKMRIYFGTFITTVFSELLLAVLFLVFGLVSHGPKENGFSLRFLCNIAALLFYLFGFRFYYTHHKKESPKFPFPIYVCAITILFAGSLLILFLLDAVYLNLPYFRLTAIIAFFCMLFSVFALLYILSYVTKQEQFKQETLAVQKLQEAEIAHIQDVYKKSEVMRKVQHDLKDSFSVMQILLQNPTDESLSKVNSILEDLNQKITHSRIQIYTHNVLLNTVLSSKIAEAESCGILVDADIQIPTDAKGIRDTDISLILVNLFKNAIDACNKLDASTEKSIRFRLILKGNFLIFKVSNPYKEIKTDKNGVFKTTKANAKEHGVGLAIIKGIVTKYNGQQHISTENQIFTHIITLELDAKQMAK